MNPGAPAGVDEPAQFRTGRFVDSPATQTLVIFAIRTRRSPLRRRRPVAPPTGLAPRPPRRSGSPHLSHGQPAPARASPDTRRSTDPPTVATDAVTPHAAHSVTGIPCAEGPARVPSSGRVSVRVSLGADLVVEERRERVKPRSSRGAPRTKRDHRGRGPTPTAPILRVTGPHASVVSARECRHRQEHGERASPHAARSGRIRGNYGQGAAMANVGETVVTG
jgi:hypothetical protein